jgi:hypothetical protein
MLQTPASPKPCIHCGKEFVPKYTAMQIACSLRCAASYVKKQKAQKEKAERAGFKVRRDAIKSRSKWEDECRKIVQAIARIRDRNDGCISCHLPANWDGQWHGSHFRSHGACSVLQFHLWNIHKACSSCNRDNGGNIINYRPKLVEKIGQERVDWLESQNGTFKPPIEYYIRFKKVMGKRLRRLEKRSL